MKKTTKLLINAFWLPCVIFAINYVATNYYWNVYQDIQADIALHFFGGISIAYATLYILEASEVKNKPSFGTKSALIFFVVCTVALAAVLWEDYEFLHDIIFLTQFQPNNTDTMQDLFFGLLGGFLYTLAHVQKKTP